MFVVYIIMISVMILITDVWVWQMQIWHQEKKQRVDKLKSQLFVPQASMCIVHWIPKGNWWLSNLNGHCVDGKPKALMIL
jgi:uncharacterized membrane protein